MTTKEELTNAVRKAIAGGDSGMSSPHRYHSLPHFAATVLSDGKIRRRTYTVGKISSRIVADMKKKGIELQSDDMVIGDDTILKYRAHPKAAKGAVVSFSHLDRLERTLKHPKYVYSDTKNGVLVYITTSRYNPQKMVKAIIHPNYKDKHLGVINKVKSWGLIRPNDLNVKDKDGKRKYTKIK